MVKYIPNFLTLCNLACGCYGTLAVFSGDLVLGSIMIWAGAIFDFLDGFAARMLNKYSSIGKDLDSLADLITFCFLPASILFVLIGKNAEFQWLPYAGFLVVIFGALRLAKFNTDTRQSEHFYGLPVPAVGMFISAFPFISSESNTILHGLFISPVSLSAIAVLLSAMMVSNIKLISLKFTNFSFAANWHRYFIIISALILLIFLHVVAFPIIILIYVVFSAALNIKE